MARGTIGKNLAKALIAAKEAALQLLNKNKIQLLRCRDLAIELGNETAVNFFNDMIEEIARLEADLDNEIDREKQENEPGGHRDTNTGAWVV